MQHYSILMKLIAYWIKNEGGVGSTNLKNIYTPYIKNALEILNFQYTFVRWWNISRTWCKINNLQSWPITLPERKNIVFTDISNGNSYKKKRTSWKEKTNRGFKVYIIILLYKFSYRIERFLIYSSDTLFCSCLPQLRFY